jgi:hypothetical protein
MLFLSKGKSPSYLLIPGMMEIIDTIHGKVPSVRKAKWAKFTALHTPVHAPGLAGLKKYDGKVWGTFETKIEAKKLDVEDEYLRDALLGHPKYGVDFIAVDAKGQEASADERYILPNDDGTFFCKACEKVLSNGQAVAGHKSSKAHAESIAEAEQLRGYSRGLGGDV